MNLKDIYIGYRPFSSDEELISAITNSKRFDASMENIRQAVKIQLYDTEKQRTHLVSTGKRVYKVLDDRRLEHPKIVWSRGLDKIFDGKKLKAQLVEKGEAVDQLVLEAIPDKPNLISKKLFRNMKLEEAFSKLNTQAELVPMP